MSSISLAVTVPVCSFRRPYARMFLESERVPPPSTVYGFLLSLVGEEDRFVHRGSRIAIAIRVHPEVSRILRTTWRVKHKQHGPGLENNRTPDYQELLTGLEIVVFIADGPLAQLLASVRQPGAITRFGGLSLGESRDLVNDIRFGPVADHEFDWLVTDPRGRLALPIWPNHVGSAGTCWGQFNLRRAGAEPPDDAWVSIETPEVDR